MKGGVGLLAGVSRFTPASISGLQLWLSGDSGAYKDAGSTVAANNDTVQQWNDGSSQTRNVSQATSGNRPTYKTNIVNGLPVLLFDRTVPTYLTAAFTTVAQPITLLMVVQWSSINFAGVPFDGLATAGCSIYDNNAFNINAGTQQSGSALSLNTWYILTATFNGASSKGRINGGAANISADAGALGVTNGCTVGATNTLTTFNFSGYLAELFFYNTALSLTDLNSCGSYLGTKYGLTWNTAT